jgi:CheY-like chemotaxis protein
MTRKCVIGEADPFIIQLLTRFATECELEVISAQVGQDVVELAHQVKPEVIIIEVELPGKMRGWDVVQALKANQATRGIPVITCSWQREADVQALVGAVAGHLQKPELHYDDFVAALRAVGVKIDDSS